MFLRTSSSCLRRLVVLASPFFPFSTGVRMGFMKALLLEGYCRLTIGRSARGALRWEFFIVGGDHLARSI